MLQSIRSSFRRHSVRPCNSIYLICRFSSTDATPPPLLSKLRTDLKTAMRARDTARLSAIRSVLAEVTNLSKTSNPVTTDMQLVGMLRKRIGAGESALEEFRAAGRGDLVEKEDAQVRVMKEYAEGVEVVGEEEIERVVKSTVDGMRDAGEGKIAMGEVLKRLFAPGGGMDGKNVEKGKVSVAVKRLLS